MKINFKVTHDQWCRTVAKYTPRIHRFTCTSSVQANRDSSEYQLISNRRWEMLYYLWLVIDGLLVTSLGIVEWVRTSGHTGSGLVNFFKTRYNVKRNRSSLLKLFCKNYFEKCPYCKGDGINLLNLKSLFNFQFSWLYLLFGKKKCYPQELTISCLTKRYLIVSRYLCASTVCTYDQMV